MNDAILNAFEADERIGGILLYEVANALIMTSGPEGGHHGQSVATLRSIMERLEFR